MLFPVFNFQSGDTIELSGIVCNQDQIVSECNGRD